MRRTGKISDEHLQCRVRGHYWKHRDAKRMSKNFLQTLVCRECGAVKMETINFSGYIVESSIVQYPDGYLVKGEGILDRKDRANLRLRAMRKDQASG